MKQNSPVQGVPSTVSSSRKVQLQSEEHSSKHETPSRQEILSIVRKQSRLLGQTVLYERDGQDAYELDMRFWREMFDMFFVRGLGELKSSQDDMVFFVHSTSLQYGDGVQRDTNSNQPYFVRRWMPDLEKLIGESPCEVDWRRSFYLNLIAHTSYSLTVAICNRQALQSGHQANSSLKASYKVTKTVFASPSRVNFRSNSSKGVETVPAYPDICFSVDDYENTFEDLVLTEEDQCYCVLLHANGGAAFPSSEKGHRSNESVPVSSDTGFLDDSQNPASPKLTLFSAFVEYNSLRAAFAGSKPIIGNLLLGLSHSKHILMHGPGGRGQVDVCVFPSPDQGTSGEETGDNAHPGRSNAKMDLGSMVRKAVVVASVAARQAYKAAASGKNAEMDMVPLRCCLMSLMLPWDTIVNDLLFKVSFGLLGYLYTLYLPTCRYSYKCGGRT